MALPFGDENNVALAEPIRLRLALQKNLAVLDKMKVSERYDGEIDPPAGRRSGRIQKPTSDPHGFNDVRKNISALHRVCFGHVVEPYQKPPCADPRTDPSIRLIVCAQRPDCRAARSSGFLRIDGAANSASERKPR